LDQEDLLERIGEATRDLSWAQARRLYRRLAGADLEPPAGVRTVDGVVDATAAVVVDAPDLLDLLGDRGRLLVPYAEAAAMATLLDLPLASEIAEYQVVSAASPAAEAFRTPLVAALSTITDQRLPTMRLHDGLTVRDADGRETAAGWRVRRGERPVIDLDRAAGPDVQARALAWALDLWSERSRLEAVLLDPARAERLSLEADLDR
jgi:hypothetical protein